MITIAQLLESVDLYFEPAWVTKDDDGDVYIFQYIPEANESVGEWITTVPGGYASFGKIKLSEFDGKDWTECIYEVPRKTTGKIEKIHIPDMDEVAESAMYSKELAKRLNQVIDAVNELKGANNE